MNKQEQEIENQAQTGLWGRGIQLEVVGITGEYGDGKTIFGLSIAPGNNEQGRPRTRFYDSEKSGGDYAGLGAERIDMPAVMQERLGGKQRPVDVFRWWHADVLAIDPGRYDVIFVDVVTDIEQGMVDYVAAQHAAYGFQSAEKFRAMGGVFWGYVKAYYKCILADLASRCKTFAFSAHLRQVWTDGRPQKDKEPQGKTTLWELASLYIWLKRDKNKPDDPPQGKIIKGRVALTDIVDGEPRIVSCLPPVLPVATPAAIRTYIADPVGGRKLKAKEKDLPHQMTPEELVAHQAAIAADERATAEATLEVERLRHGGEAANEAVKASDVLVGQAASNESENTDVTATEAAEPLPVGPANDAITTKTLMKIAEAKRTLSFDSESWKGLLAQYEVASAKELSEEAGGRLLGVLQEQVKQATSPGETDLDQWANDAISAAKK